MTAWLRRWCARKAEDDVGDTNIVTTWQVSVVRANHQIISTVTVEVAHVRHTSACREVVSPANYLKTLLAGLEVT